MARPLSWDIATKASQCRTGACSRGPGLCPLRQGRPEQQLALQHGRPFPSPPFPPRSRPHPAGAIANPQAAPAASWHNCLVSKQAEERPPPLHPSPAPSRGTFPTALPPGETISAPRDEEFWKSWPRFARSQVVWVFPAFPPPRCCVRPASSPPAPSPWREEAAASATSSICCENITGAGPARRAREVQRNSQAPGAKVSSSFSSPWDDFQSPECQPLEEAQKLCGS